MATTATATTATTTTAEQTLNKRPHPTKYRSKEEVWFAILKVLEKADLDDKKKEKSNLHRLGCNTRTKTGLLYSTGINFNQSKPHMKHLESNGFVRHVKEGRTTSYFITQKGRDYLRLLNSHFEMLHSQFEMSGML